MQHLKLPVHFHANVYLLFIVLFSISPAGVSQTPMTHIPDATFRRVLAGTPYNIIFTGESAPTVAFNAITSLDVSGRGVSDLTGIEAFTALTTLLCNSNQLSSLDVSQNIALTVLECHSNQLTSLDVSANTALTVLKCQNNQLTSLDVSANTALTELNCGRNRNLTSLNVSANTALITLSCSISKLTSLDVTNNTALTSLTCSSNQLTSLDVSQNTALTELYCDNNQLTSLDVSASTALTVLFCQSNQLTCIQIADLGSTMNFLKDMTARYSEDCSITALTVVTTVANDITATVATLGGVISVNGGERVTERGIVYSATNTNPDPEIGGSDVTKVANSATTDTFSASITGLMSGTTYSYKAYAINSAGTSYGDVVNFTTSATATATVPTVSTTATGTVMATSATLGGDVTANGGAMVTERGIVYSDTNTNPEIGEANVTKAENSATTDTFSASITGLMSGTTYSYKAYAINSAGTSYGDVVNFMTAVALAVDDFETAGITISPNPTSGMLNIAVSEKAGYSLSNTGGKILEKGTLTSGENEIDISHLSDGLYFLNIETSRGRFTSKVVISSLP